ncbi:cation:proton antiporter [Sutterella sp.]|uniref:cation:proton antiporter n=1 Tax=Sutterella sp. TaxID=1981025 RepID=UPI0026E02D6D|nr:cation:proton antiporter [Sutterella sp.]MDO5531458.1 cation:proton antiporter [Sutterella sp.]
MEHSLPLISTLVIAFSLALVFGFIAERFLRSPALVGYLLAGIAAGKYTPGVFADAALANQLSEIGVMLLMFGVGLHFSMKDLWSVKGIAVPGAVLQMFCATLLGALGAHYLFDYTWAQSIVLGISLSCASTVVLLKALEVRGKLTSSDGRIAVGWLIVEDLATVLILVLLPPFASIMIPGEPGTHSRLLGADIWLVIGQTLLNAAIFVAVMLVVGRRVMPCAMAQVARTGSRELFTLFVLACAVGVAYGAAEIFHVSFALGSFFAGMVMRESRFAHRAATESIPLQDAFAVLFFVGVGMLFDWHILLDAPLEVLAVLVVILFGKSLAAFVLVNALRYPLRTAIIVAVSLAQIGEFSFILIGQAVGLGLATEKLVNLVVAGSILSIALNPIGFWLEPKISRALTSRWKWARKAAMREAPFEVLPAETAPEKLVNQAVVTGRARMVEHFARPLEDSGVPIVAVVDDEEVAEKLSQRGISVILGDPSKDETWVSAHLHRAKLLVLLDSSADGLRTAEAARHVSPEIPIVVADDSIGIWPEVTLEKVTFLSTLDSAARLFSAQTASALKTGVTIGVPVGPEGKAAAERAEKAQAEKAAAEQAGEQSAESQEAAEGGEGAQGAEGAEAPKPVKREPRPIRRLANFFSKRKAAEEKPAEELPQEVVARTQDAIAHDLAESEAAAQAVPPAPESPADQPQTAEAGKSVAEELAEAPVTPVTPEAVAAAEAEDVKTLAESAADPAEKPAAPEVKEPQQEKKAEA